MPGGANNSAFDADPLGRLSKLAPSDQGFIGSVTMWCYVATTVIFLLLIANGVFGRFFGYTGDLAFPTSVADFALPSGSLTLVGLYIIVPIVSAVCGLLVGLEDRLQPRKWDYLFLTFVLNVIYWVATDEAIFSSASDGSQALLSSLFLLLVICLVFAVLPAVATIVISSIIANTLKSSNRRRR